MRQLYMGLTGLPALLFIPCRAETAVQSGTLRQLASELRQELAALSSTNYTSQPLLQLKKQALIVDLMHNVEVVDSLIKANPTGISDWEWSRQLRYYATQVSSTKCLVYKHAGARVTSGT
jgi:dynein heavy chain 2